MIGVFDHPFLGGLFGDDAMAAIWSPEAQIGHFRAFEAAWSRALGATGRVDDAVARAAAAHVEATPLDPGDLRAGTARDGLPIPALVEALRATAPVPGAIHAGATSQDVMDTALALSLVATSTLIDGRLGRLSDALDGVGRRFGDRPMMGRTRMQAAMPITVADRLRTWAGPLATHRARLAELAPRIARVQIGGAAGDRAKLGADAGAIVAHIAAELRLGAPETAWHATRDGIAEYASLLSLISGGLGKMGQDVCLMAQQGVDEIALSGGGGSSAMPHKQNPILAELLVTLARFNATQVSAMHHALVHEQERSGAAWSLEWMVLPQMAMATARALGAATAICEGIERIGTPDAV